MIVAILIGRKGSTGFPGKNLFRILGRPLAEYPLLAAKNSRYVDKIFLSTDDQELQNLGRLHSADIIERPADLASNTALGEDAYVHAYGEARKACTQIGSELELLVLLMCNAATVSADLIDEGVEALRSNPGLDSAVSVSRYNMWSPLRARTIDPHGLLKPMVPFETFGDPQTLNCDRDSQGDVWFADMGVSVVRPGCLERLHAGLLPQKWMGRAIHPLKQWGGLDVDYEWQTPGVEFWLRRHGFSEEGTPYGRDATERGREPGSGT